MIKENELRLGNYFIEDGIIKTVNAHTFNSVVYEQIEPIPLTPEILAKAGFEYDLHTWQRIGNDGIILAESNDVFHLWIDTLSYSQMREIKYLHQLQNLYFALTGEELNIEL